MSSLATFEPGEIPSMKLLESEFSSVIPHVIRFIRLTARIDTRSSISILYPEDIVYFDYPIKDHGEKLHDVPDEYLVDTLQIAKKLAIAAGATDYNILQNNGKIAHQIVPHVHFHVIPKPAATDDAGLVIGWPAKEGIKEELQKVLDDIKSKL
ncbi:hypothetical protein FRC10_010253 [Ceratobasidium sp. 414]|nr:hypothetical protein FRC10_010253 [Ceratobasidium sp. 414]